MKAIILSILCVALVAVSSCKTSKKTYQGPATAQPTPYDNSMDK